MSVANTIDVQVPDIGDFTDVEVIEVHVAAGDRVSAEDPLITLETDKASMDVPAPEAGEVVSVAVAPGSRVSEGTIILAIRPETGAEAAGAPAENPPKSESLPAVGEIPDPAVAPPAPPTTAAAC